MIKESWITKLSFIQYRLLSHHLFGSCCLWCHRYVSARAFHSDHWKRHLPRSRGGSSPYTGILCQLLHQAGYSLGARESWKETPVFIVLPAEPLGPVSPHSIKILPYELAYRLNPKGFAQWCASLVQTNVEITPADGFQHNSSDQLKLFQLPSPHLNFGTPILNGSHQASEVHTLLSGTESLQDQSIYWGS